MFSHTPLGLVSCVVLLPQTFALVETTRDPERNPHLRGASFHIKPRANSLSNAVWFHDFVKWNDSTEICEIGKEQCWAWFCEVPFASCFRVSLSAAVFLPSKPVKRFLLIFRMEKLLYKSKSKRKTNWVTRRECLVKKCLHLNTHSKFLRLHFQPFDSTPTTLSQAERGTSHVT